MGQALGEGKVSKIFINVSRVSWEVTSAWERRSGGGQVICLAKRLALMYWGSNKLYMVLYHSYHIHVIWRRKELQRASGAGPRGDRGWGEL